MNRVLVGTTVKAGRGKSVTLQETEMLSSYGHSLDRRVLGAILSTRERYKSRTDVFLREKGYDVIKVFVPVSTVAGVCQVPLHFTFLLNYDGKKLSIGCFEFSARATRLIVRWSQQ